MPTLEQLLSDVALTDDLELDFGAKGKVKVGDLRAFAKATADAKLAAERQGRDYETEKAKAKDLAEKALALNRKAEEELAALNKRPKEGTPSGEIDWENDPVYSPINKRLAKDLEPLSKITKALEDLQKAFGAGFRFVTEDYNDRRWNALPKESRELAEGKGWRDFVKAAEEGKVYDRNGLLDPIGAFEASISGKRRDAELKAAEERGRKKAEEDNRLAGLSRPGSTPRVPPSAKDPKIPKFGSPEWTEAVLNDPEIQRIASGDAQA